MKKLKLCLSNMEGVEVLSREQLKKVIGGEDEGSGDDLGGGDCNCPSGKSGTKYHCFWVSGACINEAKGKCDGSSNCDEYCVTATSTCWL